MSTDEVNIKIIERQVEAAAVPETKQMDVLLSLLMYYQYSWEVIIFVIFTSVEKMGLLRIAVIIMKAVYLISLGSYFKIKPQVNRQKNPKTAKQNKQKNPKTLFFLIQLVSKNYFSLHLASYLN